MDHFLFSFFFCLDKNVPSQLIYPFSDCYVFDFNKKCSIYLRCLCWIKVHNDRNDYLIDVREEDGDERVGLCHLNGTAGSDRRKLCYCWILLGTPPTWAIFSSHSPFAALHFDDLFPLDAVETRTIWCLTDGTVEMLFCFAFVTTHGSPGRRFDGSRDQRAVQLILRPAAITHVS